MKCIIPGSGIRAFGKSVYCLAKIGDEFYVETTSDWLALKTVNPARSGFAYFNFKKSFFNSFKNQQPMSCKMLSKSFVSVFRGLSSLEKSVDYCTLDLDSSKYKMTFVFHCKYGIIKTHQLGFEDCEALRAVYDKDSVPNTITQCSRPLQEALGSFPSNISEVSLCANANQLLLSNYVDDQEDNSLHVPMSRVLLYPDEFEDYQTEAETSITFCLKELKAILTFTSALGDSLSVRFEMTGRPVIFSIEGNPFYTADFVLATLSDPDSECHQTQTQGAPAASRTSTTNNITGFTETSSCSQPTDINEHDSSKSRNFTSSSAKTNNGDNNTVCTVDQTGDIGVSTTRNQFENSSSLDPIIDLTQDPGLIQDPILPTNDFVVATDRTVDPLVTNNSQTDRPSSVDGWVKRRRPRNIPALDDDDDFHYDFQHKDQFVSQSHSHTVHENQDQPTQDSVIDSSGFLPSTPPPTKKFKSIFSASDMFGGVSQGSVSVLAPDSEDEDSL